MLYYQEAPSGDLLLSGPVTAVSLITDCSGFHVKFSLHQQEK